MSDVSQPVPKQGRWYDYFSAVAADYARYRPQYPASLFEYLAAQCPQHQRAWDCATGNGQAALALTPHFQQVWATDASAQQIAQAEAHPQVKYRCAPAEDSGLAATSVDLVCVAQALHWFPLDAFYQEVKRVLRPGGCLAVWAYAVFSVDDPQVNAWLEAFYGTTLEAYWAPQRRLVEEGYRNLSFPFTEQSTPGFTLDREWDIQALAGYLSTWSATQKYRSAHQQAHGVDPFPQHLAELSRLWPSARAQLQVRWPVHLRLGRAT